jgi:hypothetical protein
LHQIAHAADIDHRPVRAEIIEYAGELGDHGLFYCTAAIRGKDEIGWCLRVGFDRLSPGGRCC